MWLKNLLHLPAEAMTGLATVIGFVLIGNLTADEQNALGNMLFLIGQILSSNATQEQALQSSASSASAASASLDLRLAALEERLKQFESRK